MVKKFALIGTSCSGKTTACLALVSRLKSYGVLADGVFSQDRRLSFDTRCLETEEAQVFMVTRMVEKEVEASLQVDTEVLISDRSALDLMSYYKYQFPDSELMKRLLPFVKEWTRTYCCMYFLPPLPYQADGKRPSDTFRLEVDKVLTTLVSEAQCPVVHVTDRSKILTSVLDFIGLPKPTAKTHLTHLEVEQLARTLKIKVAVKRSVNDDVLTDTDLFLLTPGADPTLVKQAIEQTWGRWVQVDVLVPVVLDQFFDPTLFKVIE